MTTVIGRFKIGWRKRVISIDWTETRNTKSGIVLFKDESTTTGERYIHAWSLDKAKQYIKTIFDTAT